MLLMKTKSDQRREEGEESDCLSTHELGPGRSVCLFLWNASEPGVVCNM